MSTPFTGAVNALCWERTVPEGFAEVVARLGAGEGIVSLDEIRLRALPVTAQAAAAIELALDDLRRLRDLGWSPELNCIHGYPRDDDAGAVRTDVYSFHADRATGPAETVLCTYHGAPSEGLRNEDARRRIDLPEVRAQLLEEFGGADDASFAAYLSERCYDLHYAAVPEAVPFSFGVGALWRIAVDYPGCPVPPCVHRAPDNPGSAPRLLLIG